MTNHAFSILTTFQIRVCHVKCVDKLCKNFISPDTLLILGDISKYIFNGYVVTKIVRWGRGFPSGGTGLRNMCGIADTVDIQKKTMQLKFKTYWRHIIKLLGLT